MNLFAIPDQRDVIVTSDAVLDGGKELSGIEIAEVAAMVDRARLETLWREVHRTYALGSWVVTPDQIYGKVTGHIRGARGADGHALQVHTLAGVEYVIPAAHARPTPPPQGAV
ncbi:hypothetical protein GCM10007147_34790 [Nocardiopsis kunsanensis]|uniref:Uncharacterized protein n=1 Tax=Nocardiopsis kunsanensis TaxID=141693 RepID=A0A919CJT1_9ACTN|nr:hypothetical protein [Nocardiopsis kunsanensis]GHD31808.1 hypothetical protein GCM10007147_34790 [Nocardiopsis kunsanensis]